MQTCRDHHDAIRSLLESFPTATPLNAPEVAKVLARLATALLAHLKLEDDHLYPGLARSSDRTVREVSLHYRTEMGGLKQTFVDFMSEWGNDAAIAADQNSFISAWSEVRGALEVRMAKEDHGLYAIAEDYLASEEPA